MPDKILLTAYPVEIAQGDDTCKYATFLISVLDEFDRMGRMIPKEAGEKYHKSLRGFPIVAKLIKDRMNNAIDFGDHEMHETVDKSGNKKVTFDTYPIGSVVDTWIEDREIKGYDGKKSCIMARAKLWTCRSPEYFKVLDELWKRDMVSSSWELIVNEAENISLGRRILKVFSFIGNALLGTTSIPAVKGAGIYEYAQADDIECDTTEELTDALLKDITRQEEISLAKDMDNKEVTVSAAEQVEISDTVVTERTENVEVTEKVTEEFNVPPVETVAEPLPEKVLDETAQLNQKIAELTNALMNANDENNQLKANVESLKAELDSLAPMREEFARLEQEKAEAEKARQIAELKELAVKSGQITEAELSDEGGDETILTLISNLDKQGLESLIVSRLISAYSAPKTEDATTDVASVKTKKSTIRVDIADVSDKVTDKSAALLEKGEEFVHAFINR